MMVNVGDIVLLNIGRNTHRPILVTKVHPESRVSGELFFYHPEDGDCPWAMSGGMFYAPAISRRSTFVDEIEQGLGIGQWSYKTVEVTLSAFPATDPQPPLSRKLGLKPSNRARRRA